MVVGRAMFVLPAGQVLGSVGLGPVPNIMSRTLDHCTLPMRVDQGRQSCRNDWERQTNQMRKERADLE